VATVRPCRTYCRHSLLFDVNWDIGGPSPSTDGFLRLSFDCATGLAVYRAAILFDEDYPLWAAVGGARYHPGSIAAVERSLHIYIHKPVSVCELELCVPASALTPGMTVAQLNTAYSGGTVWATNIPITSEGWLSIVDVPTGTRTNGVILSLTNPAGSQTYEALLGRSGTDSKAMLYTHFQYTIRAVIDAGDPVRPDLTAVAEYLDGRQLPNLRFSGNLGLSALDSKRTDVALEMPGAGQMSLSARVDPQESWKVGDTDRSGSVAVGMPDALIADNLIDDVTIMPVRGAPVDVRANLLLSTGAQTEIARLLYNAGSVEQGAGDLSIGLEGVQEKQLQGTLCRILPNDYLPADSPSELMNWVLDSSVRVAWDAIMNALPVTKWDNILAGDWTWLLTRFAPAWYPLGLPSATVAAIASPAALLELAASQFCLMIGSDLSGNPVVWHPAAYRPSMRVHTLDLDDATNVPSLRTINEYDGLQLTATYGGTDYEWTWRNNPNLSPLEEGNPFTYDMDCSSYLFWAHYRHALYLQLLQRVLSPIIEVEYVTSLRALTWALGDQVLVTSAIRGLTAKPFMVTGIELDPASGEGSVRMCHFTGWPGGHSLFQTAGPLGIWRWKDHDGALTYANQAWRADKVADFSASAGATVSVLSGSWEGAALKIATVAGDRDWLLNAAVLPVAAHYDTLEVQVANWGATVELQDAAGTGNAEREWLWRWIDSTSAHLPGLVLFVHNPNAPNPATNEEGEYVLAWCSRTDVAVGDNWAGFIVEELAIPHGVGRDSTAGVNELLVIRSISIVWNADETIDVYDGGHFIGTITARAKADIDRFDIRSMESIQTGSSHITPFLLRYDSLDAAPAVNTLLPQDGIDPVYP